MEAPNTQPEADSHIPEPEPEEQKPSSPCHDESSTELKAKFDLSLGTGVRLAEMPALRGVRSRGIAWRVIDNSAEFLHRFVYGRPGKGGERLAALKSFRGFPEDWREDIVTRLGKLKRQKLIDFIRAFGLNIKTSNKQTQLIEDVAKFLMKPEVSSTSGSSGGQTKSGPKQSAGNKRLRSASPAGVAGKKTVPVQQTLTSERVAAKSGPPLPATYPSDDTLRVLVFRRVLHTPRAERVQLTTRLLRMELQQRFGDLESRKSVIKEAAAECVAALIALESAALTAAAATATEIKEGSQDDTANPPALSGVATGQVDMSPS